ncbi:MAG: MBL fold metallo-hydrolase [Bacteroidales bacterium]
MNQPKTHIELFSSGYCTANSRIVFPDEPAKELKFHAVWALITHPLLGYIIFDTGYSSGFFKATRYFPNRFYRWATPVNHKVTNSCTAQLAKRNITPSQVKNLIISHFHADHIGGLKDFPVANIWCNKSGLAYALSRKRMTGFIKGVLRDLIPENILSQSTYPEDQFESVDFYSLHGWKWTEDMYFIHLPGHFRGQTGLYLKNTNLGEVLLCADAAWSIRAIEHKIYPSRIVSLFIDNYGALKETIDKLNLMYKNNPELRLIPCHCATIEPLIQNRHEI